MPSIQLNLLAFDTIQRPEMFNPFNMSAIDFEMMS